MKAFYHEGEHTVMKNTLALIPIVLVLGACQTPVNHTKTYGGACYQLVRPSVIYQGWCSDDGGLFSYWDTCPGLQSFPFQFNDWNGNKLTTIEQYREDPEFWNEQLFDDSFYARDYRLTHAIAAGTRIELVEIIAQTHGLTGQFWAVQAKILTGDHQDELVSLPTSVHHLAHSWVVNDPWKGPLELKSDYAVRCD